MDVMIVVVDVCEWMYRYGLFSFHFHSSFCSFGKCRVSKVSSVVVRVFLECKRNEGMVLFICTYHFIPLSYSISSPYARVFGVVCRFLRWLALCWILSLPSFHPSIHVSQFGCHPLFPTCHFCSPSNPLTCITVGISAR